MITSNPKQKAFSLIEAMLVMAAIVIIGVIAFGLYKKVTVTQMAQKEAEDLRHAQAEMRARFPRGVYTVTGTLASAAYNMKIFPDNKHFQISYGNNFVMTPWSMIEMGGGANSNRFSFAYSNIPSDACVEFVSRAQVSFPYVSIIPNRQSGGNGGIHGAFTINGKSYRNIIKNDYIPTLNSGVRKVYN